MIRKIEFFEKLIENCFKTSFIFLIIQNVHTVLYKVFPISKKKTEWVTGLLAETKFFRFGFSSRLFRLSFLVTLYFSRVSSTAKFAIRNFIPKKHCFRPYNSETVQ